MMKIKNKTIVGMLFVPFLVAALMCCCVSEDAQAQGEPYIRVEQEQQSSSHASCHKEETDQSQNNADTSNECKCHISAVGNLEVSRQMIVKNYANASNSIVRLDGFSSQDVIPSSEMNSLRISGNSPPIYIRLAHLLI